MRLEHTEREHLRGLTALEGSHIPELIVSAYDKDGCEDYLHYCCRTFFDGEAITGIVGPTFIRTGVAEGWGIFTPDAKADPAGLIDALRTCKKQAFEIFDVWRIQTVTPVEFVKSDEMIRAIGLEFEGTLDSYLAPGLKCNLYAAVRS